MIDKQQRYPANSCHLGKYHTLLLSLVMPHSIHPIHSNTVLDPSWISTIPYPFPSPRQHQHQHPLNKALVEAPLNLNTSLQPIHIQSGSSQSIIREMSYRRHE